MIEAAFFIIGTAICIVLIILFVAALPWILAAAAVIAMLCVIISGGPAVIAAFVGLGVFMFAVTGLMSWWKDKDYDPVAMVAAQQVAQQAEAARVLDEQTRQVLGWIMAPDDPYLRGYRLMQTRMRAYKSTWPAATQAAIAAAREAGVSEWCPG